MFLRHLVSCLLLVAISATRATLMGRDTGKATLKFSTGINTAGFTNIPEKDRARARALLQFPHFGELSARSMAVSAANAAVSYTANVGVGTPPTYHTLLIDTGSAITWVGASEKYVPTNSSVNTGGIVSVLYGSGAFVGEEWVDTVTLGSGLVIQQQTIGVANWTVGFNGVDGILGLGPTNLTIATTTDVFEIPTVMDNLYSQGTISQEVLGVFFPPASQFNDAGKLTFGGYDDTVMTSSLNYVPLTTTFPASLFWGIDQSILYGDVTILPSTAGIVDTGTTLILVATDAFVQYQSLTGATLDPATGLLTVTPSQYANLKTLSFNIGGTSYSLTPNAQIWPRLLNSVLGGNANSIYLVVTDIGFPDGLLFNFVDGYCFLERYYSVFDTTRSRIGFAETMHTYANTN